MKAPSNGTDTSDAAAASIDPFLSELRAQVYDFIRKAGHFGRTCDEVEQALTLKHQTASARVYELHKQNYIIDNGTRRLTRSGRTAKVWVINAQHPTAVRNAEATNVGVVGVVMAPPVERNVF